MAEAICARVHARRLAEDDCAIITAVIRDHVLLGQAFTHKSHTLHKVLAMIFGTKTEKTATVIPREKKPKEKRRPRGHGRNDAASYTGGTTVTVAHPSLTSGDTCPECGKGKVYPTAKGVMVRITGAAPLTATSFEREKFRCNLCGEVFCTQAPGPEKYDATAGAMIALLKYGTGVPFNRLEQLQESMGVPLPASTQWDIVEKTADRSYPAYRELVRQAAQGELIHNDDTTMKLLAAANEGQRRGTFTTGILSVRDERKIALFFTGHKHAGENLTELLMQRHSDRASPLQMADALARNRPKEFATVMSLL